jgi:DNA-binding transcriptional LysR family regulator
MTHDQLVAFVAVASQGTFSAASSALHKTQPAVSKLVRNLEEELGLVLFDRSAYRPRLTDAGQRFYARALAVVAETEALRSFGRQLAGTPEPVVRLVLEAITPLSRIIPVLQRVQARFPSVRYQLRTERRGGVVEALAEDDADLVVTSPQGADRRRLSVQPLCEVRIVAVARFDHPLATAPSPVPSHRLREHPQVVLRDSGRAEPTADINVLPGGRHWSVTEVAAKHELITAGMGWGGLPEHVATPAIARGELVRLDVREFEVDAIELCTLRRRDRAAGVVAEALWVELGRTPTSDRKRTAPTRRR